jgi:hypothetical protein
MNTGRWACAVILVATAALAGCGGDSGTADPVDSSVRACDFLTVEQVDGLLGTSTRSTYDDDRGIPGSYCSWGSLDSNFGDAADADYADEDVYSLDIEEASDDAARADFDKGADEKTAESVKGLGDEAYYRRFHESDHHEIDVRVGSRVFSVNAFPNSVHALTDEMQREIERQAAELVVARLTGKSSAVPTSSEVSS